MSIDVSDISIHLYDSQCNYSQNDESRDLSIVGIYEEETSAFPEIQGGDSDENTGSNSYSVDEISKKILYCPCCLSTVEIEFKTKKIIKLECQKRLKEIDIFNDIEEYFHENDIKMIKDEKIENLYCRRHEKINVFNKYERYCINCKYNLCVDCNFTQRCENHDFMNLNLDNKIKKYLDDYLRNNEKPEDEYEEYFCKLIKVLMHTNEEFPNYKTLKSLENLYDFLKNGNEKNENDSKEDKTDIFIEEREDLTKKNLKSSRVCKIKMEKNNFKNLKFLGKTLSNNTKNIFLTELTLVGNNITSIKYLVESGVNNGLLINLKKLDLSRNKLGDDNIKYIDQLNCVNLEEIYLYTNMFTDYTLFNVLNKKFKNLEKLQIGFNRFDKNCDNLTEIIFPKLKNIGLNYVFNENNYNNLAKFKLEKLEELYIQNNGISQLNFLAEMNLSNIKEIYLINNELEEIDVNFFIRFKNLERIYISDTTSKIINFSKTNALYDFKYFDFNNTKINLKILEEKGLKFIRDLEIML